MTRSALYVGRVRHARLRPVRHQLRYPVFMGLFDLDELAGLPKSVWAFGYNRAALISFYERDHGDGSARPLRAQIEALLAARGLDVGGAIQVLCMPRVFGYVFNPLSVFFCHARDGRLAAIVHQVNNTFGERHFYVLPADAVTSGRIDQACDKAFRVSPFLGMDLHYRFSVRPPEEEVSVAIVADDAQGVMLTASFSGARRPFTSGQILRELVAHPAMTLGVVAAIHWEALQIWLKLKARPEHRRRDAPV